MTPLRLALAPLAAALASLLSACEYAVPGVGDIPTVDDARVPPVESDVDMEGFFYLLVALEDPQEGGTFDCYVTEWAEGDRRDDIDRPSCVGCDRYYRLQLYRLDDTASDPCGLKEAFPYLDPEGRRSDIGLVPIDDAAGDYRWLGNYGYSDLLYNDWTPWGPNDGEGYSFFMYGAVDTEVLEGQGYREGEFFFYSYYYYGVETDIVPGGMIWVSSLAYLGAYH